MKKILSIAFLLISILGNAQKADNSLMLASYNIRWNSPDDGVNKWENRKEWLAKSIRFFEIDIVGAQEVTYPQLMDMEKLLPNYHFIGEGRGGGKKGEHSPIFYAKDRFEVLDSNTFWLSETPKVTASKGWDAALPRIVTWAKFKDKKEGKTFYFFNTHFDHKGAVARKESAELIAAKIKEIAGDEPVVLSGDFNIAPDSAPYRTLIKRQLEDSFLNLDKEQIYTPGYTFNSWDITASGDRYRIDYIFYKGEDLFPVKYHVLDGQRGERFISDHFPVIVKFEWKVSSKEN